MIQPDLTPPIKTMQLLQEKREELLRLARQHGVASVKVFGSVARGDDRPDSDIDLLVTMEPKRDILDLVGFKQDAAELLDKRVDCLSEGGIHHLIREQVLSEALPL